MNLEDELKMINDLTTSSQGVMSNDQVQAQAQVVQPTTTMQAPGILAGVNNAPQPVVQPLPQVNQPAMVNPSVAQATVNQFNIGSLDFDMTKPIQESNPLIKLVGQQGEIFRLHILPGTNPKEVRVHWDNVQGHNFCCLAQAYSTPGGYDDCCHTHDRSKQRFVVPVVLIPSSRGMVQMGAQLRGELRVLVVSGKTLQEIKDQADMSGTTLEQADLIATVKDPRYKSFNFALNPQTAVNSITNISELQKEWQLNSTNENVIRTCGRLITREEYNSAYSNYDFHQYKQSYSNGGNNQQQGYNQQGGFNQGGYTQGGYNQQPTYEQAQAAYIPQDQAPYGSNPYGY